MRSPITQTVQSLPLPDDAVLAEARRASDAGVGHAQFLDRIPSLHAVEYRPPARPLPWPGLLRVAAFNVERLKNRDAVRGLMDRAGVHVGLLSEVDVGMARSGNAHTVRELTGASGEGYLYGIEFVELDLGDKGEMLRHAGERNACSFHGNAIVTGLELKEPHVIPLEESGLWFQRREGAQRRIGGRIAVAARVTDAPRPLWLVGVHLESKTDPADRCRQMRSLLSALDRLARDEACIIGGDFNTKALPREEGEWERLFDAPERAEPLFADLKSAGFAWAAANLARPTQSAGPSNKHKPPFGKLDWIVARGIEAENPQVVPAVDGTGTPISDHEMITAEFRFV